MLEEIDKWEEYVMSREVLVLVKVRYWNMNFNEGITMCLDTYCDINSASQHNCFY